MIYEWALILYDQTSQGNDKTEWLVKNYDTESGYCYGVLELSGPGLFARHATSIETEEFDFIDRGPKAFLFYPEFIEEVVEVDSFGKFLK